MKQFIVGMVVGASLMGTGALAVDLAKGSGNPIAHLPVQDQINAVIDAVDQQFDNIHEGFQNVGLALKDIDNRLTALEEKNAK